MMSFWLWSLLVALVHWTLFFLASSVVFTTVVAMSWRPAVGPDTDVVVVDPPVVLVEVEVDVEVVVVVVVVVVEVLVDEPVFFPKVPVVEPPSFGGKIPPVILMVSPGVPGNVLIDLLAAESSFSASVFKPVNFVVISVMDVVHVVVTVVIVVVIKVIFFSILVI